MNRRRIQPRVAAERLTVGLRRPAPFVRAVEQRAKCLGGSIDRRYGITRAIQIAPWQDAEFLKTLRAAPAAGAPSPTRRSA